MSEFMRGHPDLEIVTILSDKYVDVVGEGYDLAIRIGELQRFQSGRQASHNSTIHRLRIARIHRGSGVSRKPQRPR